MKESDKYSATAPLLSTPKGVEAFLSGEYVEGIGPVYAHKLVSEYGTEVIQRLLEDPESIKCIPSSRTESASKSIKKLTQPIDLLLFLYTCGIQQQYIDRILGKYRKQARDIIIYDPYQMVEDVWQLSFFTADKIGKALGIPQDDKRRLRGAILTAIKRYAENGHLFATTDQAVEYASEITGVEPQQFEGVVDSLVADERIIRSKGGLYLPVYYHAERNGAQRLLALASAPVSVCNESDLPLTDISGHKYSPKQLEAMRLAIESPVMILTGGPGTGKTTVLKGILDYFESQGITFTLVAPTGRAAKRMSALTGYEAQTIHRLLGYRQGEGYHNKSIDTDLLVIDEGSMMEQVLFDHLLEAVKAGTKIIMVGDVDQLPAIGAGDVMREIIKSGAIPVARLEENFRQESGSNIAANARAINQGCMPVDSMEKDFKIVEEKGVAAIHERILELVSSELPDQLNISPTDIQVVTPQQIGPLGARQLNVDLQRRINPDASSIRRGSTEFRLGDPVMQRSNSRERGLYNGEIGLIVEVDPDEGFLIVNFSDDRRSVYQRSELSELSLAYAMSVHKLQGSEVNYMVMPLTLTHRPMLYRNLLYTAVSRARRLCVLVGEKEAIHYAIDNNRDSTRNSNFSNRLSRSDKD